MLPPAVTVTPVPAAIASAISVRVDGTSVWLSGRVRDGAEWERAIAIADDVEGVETVDASELFYD